MAINISLFQTIPKATHVKQMLTYPDSDIGVIQIRLLVILISIKIKNKIHVY